MQFGKCVVRFKRVLAVSALPRGAKGWTVLPANGCTRRVPEWPVGKLTPEERTLWKRLWVLPVAEFWHAQRIEPFVVATYVRLATTKPEHASVIVLARELGLTPAALQRLRLVVEEPEAERDAGPDPYAHLRAKRGGE